MGKTLIYISKAIELNQCRGGCIVIVLKISPNEEISIREFIEVPNLNTIKAGTGNIEITV